jgi:hypothetical protein
MLVVPFELTEAAVKRSGRGPVVLVLILEPENVDRLKLADPVDLMPRLFAPALKIHRPIRDLDIVIAYEEDIGKIAAFHASQDIAGLLVWLERGRKHHPGDATPPVKLRQA